MYSSCDTKPCTCAYIWFDIRCMHWSIYMQSNICFMHCNMHETVLTIYIYDYMLSNICFMHCSMHETCLANEWYQYLAHNCTNHHATICFMHEPYVSFMKHMFHEIISWNICFMHMFQAHMKASIHETYVDYIIWHIFHVLWYKALHMWLYEIKHMPHALKHIHYDYMLSNICFLHQHS